MAERFISTNELARMLGISRVAVFKKIRAKQIKARKIGHDFIIDRKNLPSKMKIKKGRVRWIWLPKF